MITKLVENLQSILWPSFKRLMSFSNPLKSNNIVEFFSDEWVKGDPKKSCNQVCHKYGRQCRADKQSELDTEQEIRDAFELAGYPCASYGGKISSGRN